MARHGLWSFVYSQLYRKAPPPQKRDLSNKTIALIGANGGIGLEAAKHFASMNPARLIIGCRRREAGEAAIKEINKATGYTNTELRIIDLASFTSIRTFASLFDKEDARLDILVLNAGIIPKSQAEYTVEGWETTIQVNNLGTSYLALLLLPVMARTANITEDDIPRIVIVGSGVHFWAKFPKEVLDAPSIYGKLSDKEWCSRSSHLGWTRYYESKLISVLFSRAFQRHLAPKTVAVVCVDPGYCLTGLRRDAKGFTGFVSWLMDRAIGWTAEEGSRQLIWAALEGDEAEVKGAYVSLAGVREPSDLVIGERGRVIEDRIWHETLDILKKVDEALDERVHPYLRWLERANSTRVEMYL